MSLRAAELIQDQSEETSSNATYSGRVDHDTLLSFAPYLSRLSCFPTHHTFHDIASPDGRKSRQQRCSRAPRLPPTLAAHIRNGSTAPMLCYRCLLRT